MRYQETHPRPPLDRFIECFWTLENEIPSEASTPERILPDGCAEIILNFANPFRQYHNTALSELQPRQFLVGQITGPISISPTGLVELIGIRFHPGGTGPFFSFPMDQVTNRVVNLDDTDGFFNNGWLTSLDDLSSLSMRVKALESVLLNHIQRVNSDMLTLKLARRIVESNGMILVDELANDSGMSSRQLERRFMRDVGMGPKMLSRILRFQQVFRAVEQNDPNWASIAAECGYYDQAHLIRDCRAFSSQTPAALFSSHSPLTEAFSRKARMSDFSNTSGRRLRKMTSEI